MAKAEGHEHHHHHHSQGSLLLFAVSYVGKGWKAGIPEAKWLAVFSLVIAVLGVMEVVQGIWTGVFHLITEGFHTLMHSVCVAVSVLALSYSRLHTLPDSKSSYGSDRAETIAAFTNGVFLIFISGFAIIEDCHDLVSWIPTADPVTANPILLLRSIAELVTFLRVAHYFDRKESMTPTQQNLGVLSLHIVGMLISDTIAMGGEVYGLHQHDGPLRGVESLAELAWYLGAICCVVPYIRHTGKVLLLCSPQGKSRAALTKALRDVSFLEGVVTIRKQYFWLLTDTSIVGSLVLSVHDDANVPGVVTKSHQILDPLVENLTIQVENERLEAPKLPN